MKKHLLYFLACLWLFACGGNSSQESSKDDKSSEGKEENISSFVMPELTNENVKESLLAYGKENPDTVLIISTNMGDMKIKLYEETPLHRANFIYLSKRKFYDGTVFYRILKKFMIQGGAHNFPQREEAKKKLGTYRVPPEFNAQKYFHKKGAIAMAKKPDDAPDMGSSPYDFFIVQGEKLSQGQLNTLAAKSKKPFSAEQIKAYTTIGGVPTLDNVHTVFGEVIEGLEVIDKIAAVKARENDGWPLENTISIKIKFE